MGILGGMMDALNFAYWLQGFVELTRGQTPDPAQWKAIREHLDLVFKKVTPKVENTIKIDVDTKDAQKAVDALKKSYEDLEKKAKEGGPVPFWPHVSPVWLDEGPRTGWPPGTTIC